MERSEFLKHLGTGALLVCTGCSIISCGSNEPEPVINFTLLLSENPALAAVGGSIARNGILIVQYEEDKFVALNRACTHQGTPVNYQTAQKNFRCPNHGSEFGIDGKVLTGPASVALRQYNTELIVEAGVKSVRIFS